MIDTDVGKEVNQRKILFILSVFMRMIEFFFIKNFENFVSSRFIERLTKCRAFKKLG